MNKLGNEFSLSFFDETGYNVKNSGTAKQFCLLLEKYYNQSAYRPVFEIMGKKNYSCSIMDDQKKKMGMTFSTTNPFISSIQFGKTGHAKNQ